MKSYTALLLLTSVLVNTACDYSLAESNQFDPLPCIVPLADGEPCDSDGECESGSCATVLPVSPRGVCWGPGLSDCYRILVFDTWAEEYCDATGMVVTLCGPLETAAIAEHCLRPTAAPSGAYPYEYRCCETTFTE